MCGIGGGQGPSGWGMGVGRGSCLQNCFHHSRSAFCAHTGSGVRFVLDRFHGAGADVCVGLLPERESCHLGCRWRQGEKALLSNPPIPPLCGRHPFPLTPLLCS